LVETISGDPGAVYGLDHVGRVDPARGVLGMLDDWKTRIDNLLASTDPKDNALGFKLSRQEPLVLWNHAWVDPKTGHELAKHVPARIERTSSNTFERHFNSASGHSIHVDEFGRVTLGKPGTGTRTALATST